MEVRLNFKICFNTFSELKQCIQKTFKSSGLEDFYLRFGDTQQMPEINESECEFCIVTTAIAKVHDVLSIVVKQLSEELDTHVSIKRAEWTHYRMNQSPLMYNKTADSPRPLLRTPRLSGTALPSMGPSRRGNTESPYKYGLAPNGSNHSPEQNGREIRCHSTSRQRAMDIPGNMTVRKDHSSSRRDNSSSRQRAMDIPGNMSVRRDHSSSRSDNSSSRQRPMDIPGNMSVRRDHSSSKRDHSSSRQRPMETHGNMSVNPDRSSSRQRPMETHGNMSVNPDRSSSRQRPMETHGNMSVNPDRSSSRQRPMETHGNMSVNPDRSSSRQRPMETHGNISVNPDRSSTRQRAMEIPGNMNVNPDHSSSRQSHENKGVTVEAQVMKSFDSRLQFKQFIEMLIGDLVYGYLLVDESINLSPESGKCLLKISTREDALKLKKKFCNIYLEQKVRVRCLIQDQKTESRDFQRKLQDALSDSQGRIDNTSNFHRAKLETLMKEYETMSIFDEKKNALIDRMSELRLQEHEFNTQCGSLLHDLQRSTRFEEMNCILNKVGIECNRLRSALPIYARKTDIIKHVTSNQVAIILGETGSGKSTQMAQYFYDAGFGKDGCIVCVQPRRVAAVSLAQRVATEMMERVGGLVGFKAGSERRTGEDTKILFTTDYGLLNECIKYPQLTKYSCIIVDEAHERSIYTDILLGMIKICLTKRTDLRLVITSATIDPKIFVNYFKTIQELRVSGRNFPVEVMYGEDDLDDFENYEERAVSKALDIHRTEGPGDVLVFLSTPFEIMRCCQEFERRMSGNGNFQCLPLHGQLPVDQQKKVFDKLPDGQRKIIFSTNCAETSITIDGVKYVVDTGVVKEMKYDSKRNISHLAVCVISKSSAEQRKGRAGRTDCGRCYRLYSEDEFDMMDSINDPEILRVDLGQAALKLAELGVNIESHDFLQPPNAFALYSAIHSLESLGALVNGKITESGRWIAKLPFPPKLGFIIHEAKEHDLLFDAVVLASVLSVGSDLFYQGFSDNDDQVVSRNKNEFSSEYGDSFTWLNIYKAWNNVERKDKSTWCCSHGVNYKSVNYAHRSIQEVKCILLKDFNIQMVEEFSEDITKTVKILRRIVCEAHALSVCNFSGNVQGVYFSLVHEKQVYVHPSSILKAIDIRPEWIVYNDLVKTSKDFIKGITTVDEEWVHELIAIRTLDVDLDIAKKRKLSLVHREEMGPSVFRALVGPRFSKLRILENELLNKEMPNSIFIANPELYTLEIQSSHDVTRGVIERFQEIKSSVNQRLMSEESDFKIKSNDIPDSSTFRAIIGSGGTVKDIRLPQQSDKVLIKRKHQETRAVDIINKFQNFGAIEEMVPFKSSHTWGFIRYMSAAEAAAAVEATRKDEFNAGELRIKKEASNDSNRFSAKISWLRNPVKENGNAFITCNPLDKARLAGQIIDFPQRSCKIEISKGNYDQLIVFNTGAKSDEEVRDTIMTSLKSKRIGDVAFQVTLERIKDPPVTPKLLRSMEAQIAAFIKTFLEEDAFNVKVLEPREYNIDYVGLVNFNDSKNGHRVCREMKQELRIDGRQVDVSECFITKMHVPARIKTACQDNFDRIFAEVTTQCPTMVFKWRKLKRNVAIEIRSPTQEDIVKTKDVLQREINGTIMDCSDQEVACCLLNKAGKVYIQSVERTRDCLAVIDFQRENIHLYGSASNVRMALEDINRYMTDIRGCQQELISMRGQGKPAGLMKLCMEKFGPSFDGLVDECQLKAVDVDWKEHSIRLIGSNASICKAQEMFSAVEEEAYRRSQTVRDSLLPDCSVCLCPVDVKELSRLEVCGHAYCKDCLKLQFSFSIENKEFPLTCAKDGCSSVFVLKDIKRGLWKKWIDQDKFTSMALNAFVQRNSSRFRFCTTPNCSVVYEVTSKENSREFSCPHCSASICTSCHGTFHLGMSCDLVRSQAKAEADMSAWMSADRSNRKQCPGCQFPINKTEGCNNMQCLMCHACFCWLCLLVFKDEQECYRHLRIVHGGFF